MEACALCRQGYDGGVRLSPSLCPSCLGELVPVSTVGALLGTTSYTRQEWLKVQATAWQALQDRVSPPTSPLTVELLTRVMASGSVPEGVCDDQGRFLLEALKLPDGSKLLFGTSAGHVCIYKHVR